MKKVLFGLLCVAATLLQAQQPVIQKWVKYTTLRSTAQMDWNNTLRQYDFTSNNDSENYYSQWDVVIDHRTNTGFIKSGGIVYTINSIEIRPVDGTPMLVLETVNQKVQQPMTIIMGTLEEKFTVAIYAPTLGLVVYFQN
jgi:hypothetical protein